MSGPALTDVPDRYDVVFSLNDGTTYGFMFADSVESNLPFRTHKALYSYSPTFLERQNVSNTYGDNFQDFFLTGAQADFSEGEGQKYFRVNDADSVRRYWSGQNVDPLDTPGQVSCTYQAFSGSISPASGNLSVGVASVQSPGVFYVADATNLYKITAAGSTSTVCAHGVGSQPLTMATDGNNIFIGGGSKIQVVAEGGSTATTFGSFGATSLVTNNNILFDYAASPGDLYSIDSSGTPTSQFAWKDAKGSSLVSQGKMVAYGGDLYIIRSTGYTVSTELWKYDGSGVEIAAQLPSDFVFYALTVAAGILFISGYSQIQASDSGSSSTYKGTIYYYSNGTLGKLWESKVATTSAVAPAVSPWGNGIMFSDYGSGSVMQYDLATGNVHSLFQASLSNSHLVTGGASNALFWNDSGSFYIYPISTRVYESGLIQTSLYDFDNTLQKVFRSIKVDATLPSGTSVDLAYQVNTLTGSYTSLQVGATPGQEYLLPSDTIGNSLSIQVSLNATNSATPILTRVYVRAAPILQQFRKREFLFDLSSGTRDEIGKSSRRTRDMSPYPIDALTGCKNLAKIATQTIPFTVADRFTGPTGMTVLADLEQNQEGYDGFAIYEVRPNVFIGRINLREV